MTPLKIEQALPGTVLWDGTVNGLHLRVRENGKKSFFLYYRTRSAQQRRPKIGDVGIGISEARSRAKNILGRIAIGADPKGEWDDLRAEYTIDELFNEVFEKHWSKKQFVTSGWTRQVNYNYQNHIYSKLGRLKLSELRPAKLWEWMNGMEDTPTTANRSLEVISKMFNYAIRKGYYDKINPCLSQESFVEQKRDRFASFEEIKKIGEILRRNSTQFPREVAFIYLLMFSGSRPRAIERATWDQLVPTQVGEFTVGVLTSEGKTSYKTGTRDVIILPPFAMAVLEVLPRDTKTITGIKMPSQFWKKVREEAGCPSLYARDWRRTFATIGLSQNIEIGAIGELLNHKSTQTTKTYAKLMPDSRVQAVVAISNTLAQMLSGD